MDFLNKIVQREWVKVRVGLQKVGKKCDLFILNISTISHQLLFQKFKHKHSGITDYVPSVVLFEYFSSVLEKVTQRSGYYIFA